MTLQKTALSDVGSYRGVHAHSCIIGNQGKMEGNSKICIGIQSPYQNICGTKFSRYLFSARSEFGIFIVFFNEVFSSYVIRVNCVSYISCCQSVCSYFGSATPHATTLFCLT